jgi:glycosyltransferase involved in cell wall biosynthesis
MALPKKINKILFVETKSKYYYPYENWYFPLKRACKKLISFDSRWNYFVYGKEKMNKMFLDFIKKERPEYIFMWVRCDEFSLDTMLRIREISPKTQVLLFFGDEDGAFEGFSRYFALFLDYGLIPNKRFISKYQKDGIEHVFFVIGLDTNSFKPLNVKKKYDVTFIGAPKGKDSGRYQLIKFLKKNKIKIKLFGWNWEKYPEFKDIYGGPLESEKMIEVLNQSKINLCFSKLHNSDVSQIKGKVFEGGACKTFVLTEYCEDYLELFKEGKEIVMFKDKEELLEKVKYYLKNEKQREQIAQAAYSKIIKNYSLDANLKKIFSEIHSKNKKLTHKPLPKLKKKHICLCKKDLNLNLNELQIKLKNYDHISFSSNKCQNLRYKEYLQNYALEKTNKPISCCDYYTHSKILGDYLRFCPESAFEKLDAKKFTSFLNISQFMVTKEYFLENIKIFKSIFQGNKINFITKKNTAFVSYPLIRIKKYKTYNYKIMKQAFEFKFLFQLFSLKYQKKLFLNLYTYFLGLEILKGKSFILKSIINTLKDKSKKKKIRGFEESQ